MPRLQGTFTWHLPQQPAMPLRAFISVSQALQGVCSLPFSMLIARGGQFFAHLPHMMQYS
jgi:hypothetical protein